MADAGLVPFQRAAQFTRGASSDPIGGDRTKATLIKTIAGHMKNGDEFQVDCPPKLAARYVQINCPTARSWFCIREVVVRASQ